MLFTYLDFPYFIDAFQRGVRGGILDTLGSLYAVPNKQLGNCEAIYSIVINHQC